VAQAGPSPAPQRCVAGSSRPACSRFLQGPAPAGPAPLTQQLQDEDQRGEREQPDHPDRHRKPFEPSHSSASSAPGHALQPFDDGVVPGFRQLCR